MISNSDYWLLNNRTHCKLINNILNRCFVHTVPPRMARQSSTITVQTWLSFNLACIEWPLDSLKIHSCYQLGSLLCYRKRIKLWQCPRESDNASQGSGLRKNTSSPKGPNHEILGSQQTLNIWKKEVFLVVRRQMLVTCGTKASLEHSFASRSQFRSPWLASVKGKSCQRELDMCKPSFDSNLIVTIPSKSSWGIHDTAQMSHTP